MSEPDWSLPSQFSTTGVHHGYRTAQGTQGDLATVTGGTVMGARDDSRSHLRTDGTASGEVERVWWGRLDPGGFIVPHVDAAPFHVRWHYPVEPAGFIWHRNNIGGHMTSEAISEPFLMHHWLPHAVWNPGTTPRVHLIVDLVELPVGVSQERNGLVMCPMIPQVQELIDVL